MVLAIIVGLLLQEHSSFAENYIKPFGTIFLNLVKFIVVPVVLFSIMCGIISMSDIKQVGICAIFIASCYGIHLTLGQMLTIILTATLASVGTAGVPGAGMIMLAMVLTSVGLPVDGIALVAGVDRIFDMGRTTVNITGDAACTIVVSHLEEKKLAKAKD